MNGSIFLLHNGRNLAFLIPQNVQGRPDTHSGQNEKRLAEERSKIILMEVLAIARLQSEGEAERE